MKIRNILASVLFAGFAAVGLAAGLKEAPARRASATIGDSEYGYVSNVTGWGANVLLSKDSEDDNLGFVLGKSIAKNEQFQFKFQGGWAGALNADSLAGGTAKGAFAKNTTSIPDNGNGNFICLIPGTYDIFINKAKQVYINYAETTSKVGVYVQLKDWEHTYVYAFEEGITFDDFSVKAEPLGAWPGKEVSVYSQGVNFHDGEKSVGGIGYVEVPYANLENTKIIINNNSSSQSGDLVLADGYYYWNNALEGSANIGKAAELVMEVSKLFEDDKSICTLKRSEAQALLNKYNDAGFVADCKACFNSTTFNTWADNTKESKANFTGEQVINQLIVLASDSNPNVLLVNNMNNTIATSTVIIIVAVTFVAIAIGSVLIIRKRHQ